LKQDSEKRKLLITKRSNLKKKLNFLKNKKENAKEHLRLQLNLAMEMSTLKKQKPILKNGKKEKLPKILKSKKE
jgi:hypothetical protein